MTLTKKNLTAFKTGAGDEAPSNESFSRLSPGSPEEQQQQRREGMTETEDDAVEPLSSEDIADNDSASARRDEQRLSLQKNDELVEQSDVPPGALPADV